MTPFARIAPSPGGRGRGPTQRGGRVRGYGLTERPPAPYTLILPRPSGAGPSFSPREKGLQDRPA